MVESPEEIEVKITTSRTVKVMNESDYEPAARNVAGSRIDALAFDNKEDVDGIAVVDSDGNKYDIEF